MSHEIVAETSSSLTRNSEFRGKISGVTQGFGEWFVDHFPWISADAFSATSALGVGVSSRWATKRQELIRQDLRNAIGPAAGLIFFILFDIADGAVARAAAKKNPEKANSTRGMNIDTAVDRAASGLMGKDRVEQAFQRGDTVAEAAAAAATIFSCLPSLARSIAEENGYVVPESGKGFGRLGTHPFRMAIGIVTTVVPEIRGVPVQKPADIVVAGASILNTAQRLQVVLDPRIQPAGLPETTKQQARERRKVLTAAAGVTLLATGATLWQLHRK